MPLFCEKCGAKFGLRAAMTMHMRTYHKQNNWFICKVCGKGYEVLLELTKHLKGHNKYIKKLIKYPKKYPKVPPTSREHVEVIYISNEDNSGEYGHITVQGEEILSQECKEKTNEKINLGTSVKTNEKINLGTSVKTNEKINLGTSVRTNEKIHLVTSVKTNEKVNLGTSFKTNEKINLGTSFKTNEKINLGTSFKTKINASLLCMQCGQNFDNKSRLDDHIIKIHRKSLNDVEESTYFLNSKIITTDAIMGYNGRDTVSWAFERDEDDPFCDDGERSSERDTAWGKFQEEEDTSRFENIEELFIKSEPVETKTEPGET